MQKLLIGLIAFGSFLLLVFLVFNPLAGIASLVICLPFIGAAIISKITDAKIRAENARLVHAAKKEKEDLQKEMRRRETRYQEQVQVLTDFGRELAAAQHKDQLLYAIASVFAKTTRAAGAESQCFLISAEASAYEFYYETGYNFDSNTLKDNKFPKSDDLLQEIIHTKKITTYISDIFGGDVNIRYFLKEDRSTYLSQLTSLALIPLVVEEDVWGIIIIFCKEEAAVRIKNEEAFFLLLVSQASIALGNAIHRGLASVDRLTQLYNRTFLQKRLEEEMEFCNRQQLPMSILMLDIDNFKEINDTYGHQEGDMVLKKIAHIISKNVRLTDVCARYGGEEFVIVLPGIKEDGISKISIAERLRAAVEKADFVVMEDKHINVTVSIGAAVRRFPEDKLLSQQELIKQSDLLLYMAKKQGKNRVCYPEGEGGGA